MFTLLRLLPNRRRLGERLPAIAIACLIAEFSYRFHGFSLGCAALLLGWLVLDPALQGLNSVFGKLPDAVERR